MSINLEVGKHYNFSTIAVITLGENYTNMKLTAMVDFKLASKFKDVVSIHNSVKNETDEPIVSYKDINYFIFENDNGEDVVLATDWIRESSIVEITKLNALVTIKDITSTDINIIKDALQSLGYGNLEIDLDKIED